MSIFDSLFNTRQPQETEDRLRKVIEAYDVFQLAAFERAVLTSKSFVLSLALVEGRLSVEEAVQCAHVEVQSQIDRWGQVASGMFYSSAVNGSADVAGQRMILMKRMLGKGWEALLSCSSTRERELGNWSRCNGIAVTSYSNESSLDDGRCHALAIRRRPV